MDVAEFFFEVDDPRQSGKCYHELSDIVMIVLCGYLADCEDFVEIHDYVLDKQVVLKEFLELPCGIPSHDTATAARLESRVSLNRPPTVRKNAHRLGQTNCGHLGRQTPQY